MWKPDNLWIPSSAGVAIAYVFMDIFPHLAKSREKLENVADSGIYGFLAHNVYLVALAGFTFYLGIVLAVMTYRHRRTASDISLMSAPMSVKTETASLVAYNFLIGYLLAEQLTHRAEPVFLFGLAMAIHVAGIDCLFREHFPNLYDRTARFAFATSVYAGWVTGVVLEISDASLALWFSFLAGGIIVVATVFELPQIRSPKQYGCFCAGACAFSGLVMAVERFS
jgi:hypothetical protein